MSNSEKEQDETANGVRDHREDDTVDKQRVKNTTTGAKNALITRRVRPSLPNSESTQSFAVYLYFKYSELFDWEFKLRGKCECQDSTQNRVFLLCFIKNLI